MRRFVSVEDVVTGLSRCCRRSSRGDRPGSRSETRALACTARCGSRRCRRASRPGALPIEAIPSPPRERPSLGAPLTEQIEHRGQHRGGIPMPLSLIQSRPRPVELGGHTPCGRHRRCIFTAWPVRCRLPVSLASYRPGSSRGSAADRSAGRASAASSWVARSRPRARSRR